MPIPMETNDKIKANSDIFSLPQIPVLTNSYFVLFFKIIVKEGAKKRAV